MAEPPRKRLRSPIYLDLDTLLAQAEYHNIVTTQEADIVETGVRRQDRPDAGDGLASDVQYQSSYFLAPRHKTTVNQAIDKLIEAGIVITVSPDEAASFETDDLIELSGQTRMTAVCLAGKMFYLLRQIIQTAKGNLEDLQDLDLEQLPALEQFKSIYLRNEPPPIPILLELHGAGLPQKVYINLSQDHFVDTASTDRVEGKLRVLGTIRQEIPGGDDGYVSAEAWLLHGWEYLIRRTFMAQLDNVVEDLVTKLELNLPAEDVHSYIKGPALIIDAIALY